LYSLPLQDRVLLLVGWPS